MKTSETIVEISKSLISFQSQVGKIIKNKKVSFNSTKYNYATLSNVLDIIREPLKENRIG